MTETHPSSPDFEEQLRTIAQQLNGEYHRSETVNSRGERSTKYTIEVRS